MAQVVIGSFETFEQAEQLVQDGVAMGFDSDRISILFHNPAGQHGALPLGGDEVADLDARGSETSAATGAAVGGLAGLGLALTALAVPGVGPLLAAGPLATALAGAGVGAFGGSLLGALAQMGSQGQPEAMVDYLSKGNVVVVVHADDELEAERAHALLRQHGSLAISDKPADWQAQTGV